MAVELLTTKISVAKIIKFNNECVCTDIKKINIYSFKPVKNLNVKQRDVCADRWRVIP